METENNSNLVRNIIIGIVLLAVIGLIVWGTTSKSSKTIINSTNNNLATTTETNTYKAPIVDIKHQYKNGVHTYAGLIDLPTPCYSLGQNIKLITNSDTKPTISIDLTSKDSGAICTQVITPTYFKVSLSGPQEANLIGTLNGKEIKFNVFEVPVNEDIDSFDVYLKG